MKIIQVLQENQDPKKQTKQRTRASWDDLFGTSNRAEQDRQQNAPAPSSNKSVSSGNDKSTQPESKPMKAVSADTTRSRMSSVRGTPEITNKLASMDLNAPDDISDAQARTNAGLSNSDTEVSTDVKTPTSLPAEVSKAVVSSQGVTPEWHMVKNLPGYLQSGIRKIGRAVFAPVTKTPIEQIQVIANLGGSGPNTQRELDAVTAYLVSDGERNADAEIHFQDKIPDYGAKIRVYKAIGYTFVIVKDFAGGYIYSWPSQDGDGLNPDDGTRSLPNRQPALPHR